MLQYSLPKIKIDLKLGGIYLACVAVILHCYPAPQLTWDSYYYIEISKEYVPSLRPAGYPFFLMFLQNIEWSLDLVVGCQFLINFLSIWFFLRVTDKVFKFKNWQYYLLGTILVTEPVALYHSDSILSDVLFSSVTLAYIGTLLLFIQKREPWLFGLHVILLFACIEVRHIALFYPYFSFACIVFYHRKLKPLLIYGAVIFGLNYLIMRMHINENEKLYNVRVYSPFSGWSHANNALYGLPYIKLDTNEIEDVETRRLHSFCSTIINDPAFKMPPVGSGFLWEAYSPLCILRQQMQDNRHVTFLQAWYLLSPEFGKYGVYLQSHFPLAYIKGFIIPNLSTLWDPHKGEMADYHLMPETNATMLDWYHKKPGDIYANHQIYKKYLNGWINKLHHLRLVLFGLTLLISLFFIKRTKTQHGRFLLPVAAFVLAFYGLTLYSSWFMDRYLLPVMPMQAVFVFVALLVISKPPKEEPNPVEAVSQA